MKRGRALLLLQTVLCVTLAVLLAAAALSIYREGSAEKADHPLAQIYTRERIASRLLPLLPLLLLSAGVSAAGAALQIRHEEGLGPVKGGRVPPRASAAGEKTLRWLLLAAALLLITAGVLNGGTRDVLGKAIKICTECVGLG